MCSFCGDEPETILHIFWQCRVVNDFIESFAEWFYDVTNFLLNIYMNVVIFGSQGKNSAKVINCILLELKYYIYKCKMQNTPLFLNNLKAELKIERSIAYSKDLQEKFNEEWGYCLPFIEAIN